MELFLTLALAHLFADFPLQTDTIARLKSRHTVGILLHVCIYVIATALLIKDALIYWPLLLGLGVAHFAIDLAKFHLCQEQTTIRAFLIDQFAHLVSMIVAAYVAHHLWHPTPHGLLSTNFLLWVLMAAMVPAGLVYYWIRSMNAPADSSLPSKTLWRRDQLLIIEQRFGLIVMGIVVWVLVTQEFQMLLQLARQ